MADLVGQDLGEGQAGAVIEGGVQVAGAQIGAAADRAGPVGSRWAGAVPTADGAAMDTAATADGDVTEFRDVDVHQAAGAQVLVAANGMADGAVQVTEAGQAVAVDAVWRVRMGWVHRGRVQPRQVGDAGRPQWRGRRTMMRGTQGR
ncbi:hypothetical protein [Actinomadura roseirufa]|uniref:hypothetical protein n=1 Tax=Actinomadura roseirufa TaxID=2094049 RepID=UPI001040F886|nr:hypothetical protein [Actinomadura roseirufa]